VKITEVRVKLMEEPGERLQAFCSITFDDWFVVRDLKIIEGANGPFVAMPSRKLTARCPQCYSKNHLRAAYCNQCGWRLKEQPAAKDEEGRAKLYADIAHPINTVCREMIQEQVLAAYEKELDRSSQPGYVSRYDDYEEDDAPCGPHIQPVRQKEPERRIGLGQMEDAQQPRGPHQSRAHHAQINNLAGDGFGAGIFD
jgi:stage V sporulation protein G